MPESGKRKRESGLSGIELTTALDALKKLLKKAQQNAALDAMSSKPLAEEWEDESDAAILEHIEGMMGVLQRRADARDILEEVGIKLGGVLKLKDDAVGRGVETDALGKDTLWSATSLLAHLRFLEELVPRRNENFTRLKINESFYRVSTMMPQDLEMVLGFNRNAPASIAQSGKSPLTVASFNDSVVVVMPKAERSSFLHSDWPEIGPNQSVFFVKDAEYGGYNLKQYVPQALAEMLELAQRLEKKIIRGVVSDGGAWLFLILNVQDDGTSTYLESSVLNNYKSTTTFSWAGRGLLHWILHSHEAFDADTDFFRGPKY
ncbi:hypothetical protein BKA70DRAFT_1567914 [Coprinopsis sp. MPI-PUGE-AT-0042]|nr:hypothetical protein BKA70DRAFT_1567914 [Coprinopsis sp. MPI-PUGE-AT-0042]